MGYAKKIEKKVRNDYIALVQELFGEVKRDLFTEDLHVYDKVRCRWTPLLSSLNLGRIRSKIRDLGAEWSVSAAEDHIQSMTYHTRASLMVDIPKWDGLERLKAFADNLEVDGYTQDMVLDILKTWGATMWARCADPTVQNRIIILLGSQGLGKDTFIKHLVGGLDHLFTGFTVQANESDTLNLITSTLCVHIEEFDRTHKQDSGLIKSIITGESFTFRGAYERKAERRKNRASFIGSCNTADLLREPGSNRRFIILPVQHIGRKYPMGESKQVLAEMKYLCSRGYKMAPETQAAIEAMNEELAPLDIEQEVVGVYLRLCRDDITIDWHDHKGQMAAMSTEMGQLWRDLSRETGHTIQTVRNIVKRKGYGIKTNQGAKYFKERYIK
jgi:predicted P-loop ATPase